MSALTMENIRGRHAARHSSLGAVLIPVPLFAKSDRAPDVIEFETIREELGDPFVGIRCPLCAWRPDASSVWQCNCIGTPEPFFESCGALWNTFLTRGLCPGCGHQWQWTSCLRCAVASPHDDWYEDDHT